MMSWDGKSPLYLPCDRCSEMPYDPEKRVALPVSPTRFGLLCPSCNPNLDVVRVVLPRPTRNYYKQDGQWLRNRVESRPLLRRAA